MFLWLLFYSPAHANIQVPINKQLPNIITEIKNAPATFREEVLCLALNIYHEARGSSQIDQAATAFVVLNRVKSPYYPNTICEVVWQKGYSKAAKKWVGAFSWTTDRASNIPKELDAWDLSQKLAYRVFAAPGKTNDPTDGATHYHEYRSKPNWSKYGVDKKRLGSHVYMKLKGIN